MGREISQTTTASLIRAGYANRQFFTGSGTFTVPAGVTSIRAHAWGGGVS